MELYGLHHVTAVTGDTAENVRFYTEVLGLRLVKKTVNQDDVTAYHLFYGDEIGRAGTEVTFFDWPNIGPNVPGVGSIARIALRVPGRAALDWWAQRLDDLGVPRGDIVEQGGRAAISLTDTEGQPLALVEDPGLRNPNEANGQDNGGGAPSGVPWAASPVPVEMGLRGLDAVTLAVRQIGPIARVMTEALGFRQRDEYLTSGDKGRRVVVFEVGPGGPGAEVHVEEYPDLPPARLGIGGVHHVAFRTPNDEQHAQWRQRLAAAGLGVTPVIDRFYFRSIYFRVPGGILFEIATDGPGFATDEDPAYLGERLSLPPFLEPYRAKIEAGLKPIEMHTN
ncbi:MAG TPA: ring-cleaving dioxygenase [Roseiflexaceae bacterium]|jgi:glyoxalase family protein